MALADRSRILRLKRAGHGLQAIAAIVGATAAEVDAALRNPAASLPVVGGGGGGSAGALWKPPYGSLKAAVQDPALTVARSALLGGTLYLSRVYVPEAITLSKVHAIVTGAGAGLTLAELGVWDDSLSLLGRTGDIKAQFAASGPKALDLTAVRSLAVGGEGEWVYVGSLQVGTTRAGLAGFALATNLIASIDGSPPRATSFGTSVLPDSLGAPGDFAGGASQMIWYGLS